MAQDDVVSLTGWLPRSIVSEITTINPVDAGFEAVMRAKMSSEDEINLWLKEFSEYSMTQWIVRRTFPDPKRYKYRKDFICHHSSYNKVKNEKRKDDTVRHKNLGCSASITFKVKNDTPSTRRNDPYIKDGFYAEVILRWQHSHPIDDAFVQSYRRMNDCTKLKLLECFRNGLSVNGALEVIQEHLSLQYDAELKLADGAFNPSRRQVYELFDKWRKAAYSTCKEDIIRIDNEKQIYLVPSGVECSQNVNAADANIEPEDTSVVHRVNMKLGICSCSTGLHQGKCCTHQIAVWQHYPTAVPLPSNDASYDESRLDSLESSEQSLADFYYFAVKEEMLDDVQAEAPLFNPENIKRELIDDDVAKPEQNYEFNPENIKRELNTDEDIAQPENNNEAIIEEYRSALLEVLEKYGKRNTSVRSGIEHQLHQLRAIRSEDQLASFLHNAASNRPQKRYAHNKTVRVQRTMSAGRRSGVSSRSLMPVARGRVAQKQA